MNYLLSVLVENKPGVLSRVTGLISRRGFNIESLTVAPTEDASLSRMTIIVEADEVGFEQITKQLHKLVSVYKISDLTYEEAVERELVLFKVQSSPERRHEVIEIANVFRAKVVDVGKEHPHDRGPPAPRASSTRWRTSSAATASSSSRAPARSRCRAALSSPHQNGTTRRSSRRLIGTYGPTSKGEEHGRRHLLREDVDPSVIQGKKVAIIGYGSQGHAHALNLLDSGVDVRVGLREGSKSAQTAQEAGLKVMSMDDAAEEADVIMMLVPDETQPKVYEEHIKDHLKPGDTRLRPRLQHPLWLHQGPRGRQRHHVRTQGPGPHRAPPVHRGLRRPRPRLRLPGRHRRRWDIVFSYCWGVGGARSGIIKATFKEETEEDLFGEQAVLCGGLVELVKAGFETLTEAGYPEELAYFEVYHEMKMIVDLMYERASTS